MTNSSLLLHDSWSILYCSMALVFTSLSSFFLISAELCLQFKKKAEEWGKSFLSVFSMKWLTVTLFLNKQRKENVCFCCFFFFPFQKTFHLPLLSFGLSTESQKSICQRVPRKLQGTCNSNSNDSSIWQAHLAIKKKQKY